MIHDVDQLLEKLVKKDALNGSSVELVFDAPTKDWVARRSGPAVDLYLYDIREDLERRVPAWEDVKDAAGQKTTDRRLPPRRYRLAYLVTAWTQRPEDEHRLLSSLLACFIRNAMLKPEELDGTLAEPNLPVYIDVAQPPSQDRSLADVWSALGGELKPSLDVIVTAPMVVGRSAPYGPPVLIGPTIGIAALGAPEETIEADGAGEGVDGSEAAGGVAASGNAKAGTHRKPKRTNQPIAPVPQETLPPNAKDDEPGLKLRVRGLRAS